MYRFRECRENAKLTQKYVALSLGVKSPSVSDWEKGRTKPTIENLIALSELYHVSIDFLLGVSDVPVRGILLKVDQKEKKDSLSDGEKELINRYRSLNQKGQELINQTIYTVCVSGIYKRPGNASDMGTQTV